MIRFIVYLVIAYIVWKLIRVFAAPRRRREDTRDVAVPATPRTDLANIKDAEFEELPPPPPREGDGPTDPAKP